MESRGSPRWSSWSSSSFVGAASSFLSTILAFPIYKTIFRQQLHTLTIRAATGQLSKEGVKHLYRGLAPPLMAKTVQGTLLFGTQGSLQHFFSMGGMSGAKACALSGCLSGAIEAILLVPFERIQNILQDGRNNANLPNTRSIMQEFKPYNTNQWLSCGIYRGFTVILVRNMVGSAIFLSCKEPIRDLLTYPGLPVWVPSLGSGAVNGAFTSLALYPLSVIIANMQAEVGNKLPHVRKVALRVWDKCGGRVSLLYRGASLIILRSCITWGFTNSIHDTLSKQLL
ncbi:solute carrier family 25 member 53 [Hyla sarda]|uniref:solute carrier family 25 member 53 n=1 Tax=Hyla sarda TaxID=327740 RepID=UPI0024C44A2A|nr:solute carrier family 25 member 53 [Hyla sarda]XP_056394265.1 solute carrier family 25 member 53 [Hyla sarda]XP_056394266.1 solute carrier family 25 member 53 [Hyla sarda]XP_056394267.1 solute carrier family 25 member 53 [Hyla sarda]